MKRTYIEPDQGSPLQGGHVTLHNMLWTDAEGSGHPHVAIAGLTVDELLQIQAEIGQYLNRMLMHRLDRVEERERNLP